MAARISDSFSMGETGLLSGRSGRSAGVSAGASAGSSDRERSGWGVSGTETASSAAAVSGAASSVMASRYQGPVSRLREERTATLSGAGGAAFSPRGLKISSRLGSSWGAWKGVASNRGRETRVGSCWSFGRSSSGSLNSVGVWAAGRGVCGRESRSASVKSSFGRTKSCSWEGSASRRVCSRRDRFFLFLCFLSFRGAAWAGA